METTENFLQNCLYWHTEISIYRCRIDEIKKQLQYLKPKAVNTGVHKKYISLIQDIQNVLAKLTSTEVTIINVIRENIHAPSHPQLLQIKGTVNSEDELFENMKACYSLFINLQQSFNYYVKESSVSQTRSRVVEFPVERRVQKDAEEAADRSLYTNSARAEMNGS